MLDLLAEDPRTAIFPEFSILSGVGEDGKFQQGEVRDPGAGDIQVGDWQRRFAAASGVEKITAAKNASLWAVHCEPKWANWRTRWTSIRRGSPRWSSAIVSSIPTSATSCARRWR